MLVQDDGAGPHGEVQAELAPGGEGCGHQEYKPEYPGGGNMQRQPSTAVHPGKVLTRLELETVETRGASSLTYSHIWVMS